jgi:hypothetical protein
MDNEGHKSQQDVVGEVKKHPWEEKPEVVVPTSESERVEHAKINDLEKKKARRQKRQARKAKFFGFVKGHKKTVITAVVIFVLILVGAITTIILLNQPKEKSPEKEYEYIDNDGGVSMEDVTIKEVKSFSDKMVYTVNKLHKEASKNIYPEGSSTPDMNKLLDQANIFISSINDEYERTFFEIYLGAYVAGFGDVEKGGEIFSKFDEKGVQLDEAQLYVYYRSKIVYYNNLKDDTKVKEYENAFAKKFPGEFDD